MDSHVAPSGDESGASQSGTPDGKMNDTPPVITPAQEPWIERHLGWFIAGVGVAALAMIAGIVALVLALVFGGMRGSTPYSRAMAKVRADREVRAVLGAPIHERWFMAGHINYSGSGGDAAFEIPVTAPKGKAVVYVRARRLSGFWHLTTLVVEIPAEKELIDVLRELPRERSRPAPPRRSLPQRGRPAGGLQV